MNFQRGIINFTTCGMVVIGGISAYLSGALSEETVEKREIDGPQANRILNMLLYAHAVDLFQSYLADIIFEILITDPRPIRGKKFFIDVLFDGPNLESVRKSVIDKYIMDLGYQSMDSLSEILERDFGIKSLRHWLTRLRVTRYVQIRNIITHNRGKVNSLYLFKSRSKIDREGDHVRIQSPLGAVMYLAHLVEKIDDECVKKFALKGYVSE